jgi:hypothetical protein
MKMNNYIKHLLKVHHVLLNEGLLNQPNVTLQQLKRLKSNFDELLVQLEFWCKKDNPERFAYELRKHIEWVVKNFS